MTSPTVKCPPPERRQVNPDHPGQGSARNPGLTEVVQLSTITSINAAREIQASSTTRPSPKTSRMTTIATLSNPGSTEVFDANEPRIVDDAREGT